MPAVIYSNSSLQQMYKVTVGALLYIQQCSQYTHHIIEMVQASEKGSSALTTGIIIGASPLCLVLVSPFVGYFVSFKTLSELSTDEEFY